MTTEGDIGEIQPVKKSLWQIPRRQKYILACLVLGSMQSYFCLSLLAPFYPGEAQSRGISQTVSGLVFATFSIIQFLSAPLFGKLIPSYGAKSLYIVGASVSGVCTTIFGLLGFLPRDDDPAVFIVLSFALRILTALGGTAWFTTGLAIAMSTFKDNTATAMGLLETAIGVGLMAGPPLGGALYEAGGFFLPFLFNGLTVLVMLPVYCCVLETTRSITESGSILSLLRMPFIVYIACVTTINAMLLIALDPVLEIHLGMFDLSPTQVGAVFLLLAGTYAITSPIVGHAADKLTDSSPLLLIGFVIVTASYIFLGPSPMLGMQNYQKLWLNLVSIAGVGTASGFTLIPTYHLMKNFPILAGFEDSLSTHGAVSGLWTSAYALGDALGPIACGWLTDEWGFVWATTVMGIVAMATTCVICFVWLTGCCAAQRQSHAPSAQTVQEDQLYEQEDRQNCDNYVTSI